MKIILELNDEEKNNAEKMLNIDLIEGVVIDLINLRRSIVKRFLGKYLYLGRKSSY